MAKLGTQTRLLANTPIPDASLKHLKGLTNLQGLGLSNTQITGAGSAKLPKALPNCQLEHWTVAVLPNRTGNKQTKKLVL